VKLPLIQPGETQTLAWIRVERGRRAHLYLPTLEKKPADAKIWPAWVTDYKAKPGPDGMDDSGGDSPEGSR
jgi:hypothetical protein